MSGPISTNDVLRATESRRAEVIRVVDEGVGACRLREVEPRACAEGDELDDVAALERDVVVGDDEPARGVGPRSAQNLVQERQPGPWSPPDRYLRQVVDDGVERPPGDCPAPIEDGSTSSRTRCAFRAR